MVDLPGRMPEPATVVAAVRNPRRRSGRSSPRPKPTQSLWPPRSDVNRRTASADPRSTVVTADTETATVADDPIRPPAGTQRASASATEGSRGTPRLPDSICPEAALSMLAQGAGETSPLVDRPDPLLGPALLRTGLAPFNASGSSKPRRSDSNYVLRSAPGGGAGRPQVHSPRPMVAASSLSIGCGRVSSSLSSRLT